MGRFLDALTWCLKRGNTVEFGKTIPPLELTWQQPSAVWKAGLSEPCGLAQAAVRETGQDTLLCLPPNSGQRNLKDNASNLPSLGAK